MNSVTDFNRVVFTILTMASVSQTGSNTKSQPRENRLGGEGHSHFRRALVRSSRNGGLRPCNHSIHEDCCSGQVSTNLLKRLSFVRPPPLPSLHFLLLPHSDTSKPCFGGSPVTTPHAVFLQFQTLQDYLSDVVAPRVITWPVVLPSPDGLVAPESLVMLRYH